MMYHSILHRKCGVLDAGSMRVSAALHSSLSLMGLNLMLGLRLAQHDSGCTVCQILACTSFQTGRAVMI